MSNKRTTRDPDERLEDVWKLFSGRKYKFYEDGSPEYMLHKRYRMEYKLQNNFYSGEKGLGLGRMGCANETRSKCSGAERGEGYTTRRDDVRRRGTWEHFDSGRGVKHHGNWDQVEEKQGYSWSRVPERKEYYSRDFRANIDNRKYQPGSLRRCVNGKERTRVDRELKKAVSMNERSHENLKFEDRDSGDERTEESKETKCNSLFSSGNGNTEETVPSMDVPPKVGGKAKDDFPNNWIRFCANDDKLFSCSTHRFAQTKKQVSLNAVEAILFGDAAGNIIFDFPTDDIVPILKFFSNERASIIQKKRSGLSERRKMERGEQGSKDTRKQNEIDTEENDGCIRVDFMNEKFDELCTLQDVEMKFKEKLDIGAFGGDKTKLDPKVKMAENITAGIECQVANREIPADFHDERYKYFLRRALPIVYKHSEAAKEYIVNQRAMLLERAKDNRAEIPEMVQTRIKVPKDIICEIPIVMEPIFSEEDEQMFNNLVAKFGNNFKEIKEKMPKIDIGECILKYYIGKNKSMSRIKHKLGRISDLEIKFIVEKEWSPHEMSVFAQYFDVFGKSWSKYQELIDKSERDLKMFFRYYTKFIVSSKRVPSVTFRSEKKHLGQERNLLDKWTIDDRQTFAICFQYYSRNWASMATCFPSKTQADLRKYYNKYYKKLSNNEQRFEACLCNIDRNLRTPPANYMLGKSADEAVLCSTAGILFKN